MTQIRSTELDLSHIERMSPTAVEELFNGRSVGYLKDHPRDVVPFMRHFKAEYPMLDTKGRLKQVEADRNLINFYRGLTNEVRAKLKITLPREKLNDRELAEILRKSFEEKKDLLETVEVIYLSPHHKLTTLPPELRLFTNLKTLDITGNRLESLPDWIDKMELDELQLGSNPLEKLPLDLECLQSRMSEKEKHVVTLLQEKEGFDEELFEAFHAVNQERSHDTSGITMWYYNASLRGTEKAPAYINPHLRPIRSLTIQQKETLFAKFYNTISS